MKIVYNTLAEAQAELDYINAQHGYPNAESKTDNAYTIIEDGGIIFAWDNWFLQQHFPERNRSE